MDYLVTFSGWILANLILLGVAMFPILDDHIINREQYRSVKQARKRTSPEIVETVVAG